MMYQPIDVTSARWCILRTSGGRTLNVADYLVSIGIKAWTPRKTFKRQKPGRCNYIDGKKPTVEIHAPILPTFVFAHGDAVDDLVALAADDNPLRPPFSVFAHQGRIPLVSDRSVDGLRQEEEAKAAELRALREAETRDDADRIRIIAMRTEQERMKALRKAEAERRKMLRAERRDFDPGERVRVEDHSAFEGMSGVVESSDGRVAIIDFGGSHSMQIDAWRLMRDRVQAPTT